MLCVLPTDLVFWRDGKAGPELHADYLISPFWIGDEVMVNEDVNPDRVTRFFHVTDDRLDHVALRMSELSKKALLPGQRKIQT